MLDETMLSRLKAQFPLFDWKDGADGVFVATGTKGTTITVVELDSDTMATLEKEHTRLQTTNELREKYPHLFLTLLSENNIQISIRRNNTEGEAAGVVQSPTDSLILLLEIEAEKATQTDGFLCFGCKKAKPKEEYARTQMRAMFCAACSTEGKIPPQTPIT